MEIKAKLEKPYTEEERCEFIVEQNHTKGYEIREAEEALEAWGYTDNADYNASKVILKRFTTGTYGSCYK